MSQWIPVTGSSETKTVSGVEADFTAMVATPRGGVAYEFVSTTNCWIKQGTGNQTAVAAAAGNMFVPALRVVLLHPRQGVDLSVIQASAGGTATLTKMQPL